MIRADDLRVRANSVKETRSGHIIRCSHGFKQKDGEWINLWLDVIVYGKTSCEVDVASIGKGDTLFVDGKLSYEEYNGKPQWKIFADAVRGGEEQKKPTRQAKREDPDDVPF